MHRKIALRLLPRLKGGIGKDPSMWDDQRELENVLESDVTVEIDLSQTALQVLKKLIADRAELAHLRELDDNQLYDFVALYDVHHPRMGGQFNVLFDVSQAGHSLVQATAPIDETMKFKFAREFVGEYKKREPNLIVVSYPLKIERRLLQCPKATNNKPIIWLDVDGVVNIRADHDKLPKDAKTIACSNGLFMRLWKIQFSPEIVKELNHLSTVCDIYWMTSWFKFARFNLAPAIGLHDFNVWNGRKGDVELWNSFERPLVWIDDDLDEKTGLRCILKPERARMFARHLLVAPRFLDKENQWCGHGLQMRHIEQIHAFLEGKSESERKLVTVS
jgi:hypothetical protein